VVARTNKKPTDNAGLLLLGLLPSCKLCFQLPSSQGTNHRCVGRFKVLDVARNEDGGCGTRAAGQYRLEPDCRDAASCDGIGRDLLRGDEISVR